MKMAMFCILLIFSLATFGSEICEKIEFSNEKAFKFSILINGEQITVQFLQDNSSIVHCNQNKITDCFIGGSVNRSDYHTVVFFTDSSIADKAIKELIESGICNER
jgi:hypothetical protein